jgi:hypothetical protein
MSPATAPLFVHASHRGASTFVFHALRRLPSLVCFNEPFNDQLGTELTPATIARHTETWDTNHRFLEASAYQEYVAAWAAVMPRYRAGMGAQGFLPAGGVMPAEQDAYLTGFGDYARTCGKRLALCEVQSLGRVGAMRGAFGGFHVVQMRNPLSQWGSLFRLAEHDRLWWFLAVPYLQIGLNGARPLYRLLPNDLKLPQLPWPADDRWERWGTTVDYIAMIKSPEPPALERTFRRYLATWLLNHVAAVSYADLVLDIDALASDEDYRRALTARLSDEIGDAPDFSGIDSFSRYYAYEAFDIASTTRSLAAEMRMLAADGRLAAAIADLGRQPPTQSIDKATTLVFGKLDAALRHMERSDRRRVSNADWAAIAQAGRLRWQNRTLRRWARRIDRFRRPFRRGTAQLAG